MKFHGAIGALIIFLALLGTSLGAIILNVDSSVESTVNYDYITDVSGLYDYSEVPEYLDYTPATNYTGYSLVRSTVQTLSYNNGTANLYYLDSPHTSATLVGNSSNFTITADGRTTETLAKSSAMFFSSCCWMWYDGSWYRVNVLNNHYYCSSVTFTLANNKLSIACTDIYGNSHPYNNIKIDFIAWSSGASDKNFAWGWGTQTKKVSDLSEIYRFVDYAKYIANGKNLWTDGVRSGNTTLVSSTQISGYDGYTATTPASISGASGGVSIFPASVTIEDTLITGPGVTYTATDGQVNGYKIETGLSITSGTQNLTFSGSNYYFVSNNGSEYLIYGVKRMAIGDLINTFTLDADTTNIIINLSNSTANYNGIVYPASIFSDNIGSSISLINHVWSGQNISTSTLYKQSDNHISSITYTVGSDTALINGQNGSSETVSLDSYYLYYRNNVYAGYSNYGYANFGSTVTINSMSSSVNYDEQERSYTYMDITKGVSIAAPNSNYYTKWSNDTLGDLNNGEIDIVVRSAPGETHSNSIITPDNEKITISYNGTNMFVQYDTNTAVDLGRWNCGILQIDLAEKKVRFQPAYMFDTYTSFSLIGDPIDCFDLPLSSGSTKYLKFEYTADSFTFSVYNTKVYLGTNSLIMNSPSLDVLDYFNTLDDYRVILKNFAAIGSSIEINDTSYSIVNNAITITDAFGSKTNDIGPGLVISYENDKCYLEFTSTHKKYDLGAVTDSDISMTGQWYFTTDLYEGTASTKKVYNWDFDNTEFMQPTDQKVIIFCGLCVVGLAICAYFFKPSIADWIIVAVALILGLAAFIGW